MKNYKYTLEPYKGMKSRYDCPGCGKRKIFTRYIDTETSEHLADHVGKCSRENNCGYHYKPKQYFQDNRQFLPNSANNYFQQIPAFSNGLQNATKCYNHKKVTNSYKMIQTANVLKSPQLSQSDTLASIPAKIFRQSLNNYSENTFVRYLIGLFGAEIVGKLVSRYFIGTSNKRWGGATVFWFIDKSGRVRAGQVKLFNTTGHTAKYTNKEGDKKSCTDWVHSILERHMLRSNEPLPQWLSAYKESENKISCLFGEQLLNLPENTGKPIAIVEAPKTAIIASVYFPQFVWLAVGGLSYLMVERCQVLQGRNVALFPDLNGFEKWSQEAKELAHLARFTVSDLLERKATEAERKQGLDLADYLTRFPVSAFQPETLYIDLAELENCLGDTRTGTDFNRLIIAGFKTKSGKYIDLLFTEGEELLPPEKQPETVKRLAAFFDKDFQPALLGNVPCWVHTDSRLFNF